MHLTIDIGNTRTKLVAFEGGEPVAWRVCEGQDLSLAAPFAEAHACERAILCTVRDVDAEGEAGLRRLRCPLLRLTASTPVPLAIRYRTPATLGVDRLAAAVGAWTAQPGYNLLVIDSGSCITFDFVTAKGEYMGGNISLGLHARLRAVDLLFPRLPKVDAEGDVPELGYDTETAIRAGVIEGMRHEIEGYVRHFRSKYDDLLVFLTGGDEFRLAETIKSRIFADPFIVPRGLEAILTYNENDGEST